MRKLSKSYAKGGSLEAHGIKEGDTFIKTVSGAIQKVKDKNGNIVFVDLSNGYRDSQPPLPFAMGGYTDLSKSKPEVINESKMLEYDVEVPEIDIEKIRTIDLDIDNNKILSLDDTIRVLKQIYDKRSINAYEEVHILYLNNSNEVIGIYNHSKGGITGTVIDVEMVCALALKCLAKGVIMSHNHPSGSLRFSDADIKVSRELKNALNLFRIALLDSIIITENGFTSMTNEDILSNGGSLSRFDNGGVNDNEVKFITYKDEEIMYEPTYSEYFVNDEQFSTLKEAKDYIDKGSPMSKQTINAYRKGAFAEGGDLGIEEEIDLTDDNRLRVKELTYEYKKPTSKELAEKYNSGAYEFMEQDKMMSGGGGVKEKLFPYAVGKDFTKENSFEISPKDVKKYKSIGFHIEFVPREIINRLQKIQLSDEKKLIQSKIDDEIRRNDKRTPIQKTKDEIKEIGLTFRREIKKYKSLEWEYDVVDENTGDVYSYAVEKNVAYPIDQESKNFLVRNNLLNG